MSRYCYCVVPLDAEDAAGDVDAAPGLDVVGVDDEPVRVVDADGVGLVVHDCDGLYDTDDPATVREWLLAHQRVVDEATEAFGTPLPFRFDTVFEGDDGTLREWLAAERDAVEDALDRFAGRREYRVELRVDPDALDERLAASDDELDDLASQKADAGEGTAFLLEKQYDERLRDLRREHRRERTAALESRLREHAAEVTDLGDRTQTLDGAVEAEGDDATTVARLALLASDEGADAVGDVLEAEADEEGVEVRYTGPWPPYTFAPEFDGAQ